jgi:DNA-binding CsgD family transcriptional regulator
VGGGDLGGLTAREYEVVLAAADGADTRAIAERLFLSPRTVEHHLSAAYRKLSVSNRAALVALLRDRAPDQTPVTRYALSGDAHIATYPSRTNGLILYGSLISAALDSAANAVVSVFADPAAAWEIMRRVWGSGEFLAPFAPTATSTESGMAYVARFERHGASPAAAYAIIRMAAAIEVRGPCPAVHAPSLVLHRRDDVLVPSANGRYLAEHLPHARYVELEGADHPPWVGDDERFFDEVERFLGSDHPAPSGTTRLLQALLAADRALDASLLGTMERFRGRPVASRDGVIYAFDGAIRAVECALALMDQQPALRLTVHAGELDIIAGNISGPAADIGAVAVRESPAGQVTVTSVVKDLALGSGLGLADGPTIRLPNGEPLRLFLTTRRASPAGFLGPAQDN